MTHFTEEERSLKSMMAEFCARRLAPLVPQMEATDAFPADLWRQAGELGLLGLYVPEEYGGTAFGDVPFMIVSEELAKVSLAFAVAVLAIFLLMAWLRRATFTPFVVYRLLLGAALLALTYASPA